MNKEQLMAQGLTEEQATNVMKQHKDAIDGNYVPKATFEGEREKVKNLNLEVANRDSQIADLGKFKGTAEDLQVKVTELEAANKLATENYNAELAKVEKQAAVKTDLFGQVIDAEDVLPKLDFDKIVYKDGKIISGLTEQVDEIRKTKPHYFVAEGKDTTPPPTGWIFGKTPPEGTKDTDKPNPEVDFGRQLAESKLGSADVAAKAQEHYFK